MKPIIEINNLDAGYDQLEVLKDVSIKLNPGEIVALIGPNGAGKSTVIKSIFSIAKQTKGTILYEGKNISRLKTYELINEGISYVSQGRIIFDNLNVRENLEIGAYLVRDKAEIAVRLKNVYERFPVLKHRQNSLAYTLSGGERQMLAIGRALMQKPKVLLLDEPSLGLSPKLQKQAFKMITGLQAEGISILIVEQNAKKAIEIADRTYLLEDGKVVFEGKGKAMLEHEKIKNVYLGGRY